MKNKKTFILTSTFLGATSKFSGYIQAETPTLRTLSTTLPKHSATRARLLCLTSYSYRCTSSTEANELTTKIDAVPATIFVTEAASAEPQKYDPPLTPVTPIPFYHPPVGELVPMQFYNMAMQYYQSRMNGNGLFRIVYHTKSASPSKPTFGDREMRLFPASLNKDSEDGVRIDDITQI